MPFLRMRVAAIDVAMLAARHCLVPIIAPEMPSAAATVHGVSIQRNAPPETDDLVRFIAVMLAPDV